MPVTGTFKRRRAIAHLELTIMEHNKAQQIIVAFHGVLDCYFPEAEARADHSSFASQ